MYFHNKRNALILSLGVNLIWGKKKWLRSAATAEHCRRKSFQTFFVFPVCRHTCIPTKPLLSLLLLLFTPLYLGVKWTKRGYKTVIKFKSKTLWHIHTHTYTRHLSSFCVVAFSWLGVHPFLCFSGEEQGLQLKPVHRYMLCTKNMNVSPSPLLHHYHWSSSIVLSFQLLKWVVDRRKDR